MSLFTLIKYPVDKDTKDFDHIPDVIWDMGMFGKPYLSSLHTAVEETGTNKLLINLMLEWEDDV